MPLLRLRPLPRKLKTIPKHLLNRNLLMVLALSGGLDNWWCACSTNMAIGDAGKLGSAITKHQGNLDAALQEYQQERMAQTAKEVGVLDFTKTCMTFLLQGILPASQA